MGLQFILTRLDIQLKNLRPKCQTKLTKPKQVLLLSNTQDLARIVQLSLETIAGWKVITANISSQGIYQAAIYQPDVLLLDTVLPDLAELNILQMIHGNSLLKTIPLILLTERMQSSDRKLYASFDVKAAIAKPFDLLDLIELINQYS